MRLWIDLTDLADWSGPFTGIQQTVFNLASRYARQADVGFLVFDEIHCRFSTIEFETVRRRLEGRDQGTRGRTVATVQQLFDRLPPCVRDLVPGPASRRVRKMLEQALRLRPRPSPPVPWTPDDLVLILGMGWHHLTMLPELHKLKRQIGFRLAGVIYDLIPEFYPQLYPDDFPQQHRTHMVSLISAANALLSISRATRNDVQRFCAQEHLPMPETRVFRLGDTLAPVTPVAPETPLPKGDFILTVGLEWRKNGLLLYQMLKLAAQQGIRLPLLVIAGRPSWVKGDHELLTRLFSRDPDLRGQVRILTDLDDSRLIWLYQNCRFTIFPSLCEGWGLPVAESMRHGKLCLASSASSIPEVGGDLVEYASPYDPRGFLDLVCQYLDPQRLASREAAIRAGYRPHDWDEAFAGFDKILRQAFS
jgi:glycosyltransferase involved in cell wall biosynthesis